MFVRFRTVTRRLIALGGALTVFTLCAYYVLPDSRATVLEALSKRTPLNTEKENLPKIVKVGVDSEDLRAANSREGTKVGDGTDQTCKIPHLEKDRPEVAKFYAKVAPLDCGASCGPNWLEVDAEGRVRPTAYANASIGLARITCEWSFFERVDDNNLRVGDASPLELGAKVERGDFFAAECTAARKGKRPTRKWHGLFMTVAVNKERLAQLKAAKRPAKGWSGLNVYVLGFDSVSQMEFRRNMPKTVDYLENVMKSNIFNGFNIVGDGTPQAYIPFLTGQTEVELPLTRKRYANAAHVDDVYPFAWANFSAAGYATLYGEDAHGIGTFTYRLRGFRKQPTDHYPATFFHRFENYCTERRVINSQCCRKCVGDTPQHKMWLRYAKSFVREYAEVPKFLLMHHSALSHDSINDFQLADDDLRDHLRGQFEGGAFRNTVVIVMADHGRRFSQLRETQQGQLEERLPFFSLFLPDELAQSSPVFAAAAANLRANAADRLVSHFDMHATFMQLLYTWPTSADTFERAVPDPHKRSLSLFNKIPADRICADAGIEPHWCTCLQWRDALANAANASVAQMLARSVVAVINEQTEPERKICAPLNLSHLISAKMLLPDEKMLRYSGAKDADGFMPKFDGNASATRSVYQLLLETAPGDAKYEVTVDYDSGAANSITVDLKSISHINAYGDRPHCIVDKNYFLATYCVCYDRI